MAVNESEEQALERFLQRSSALSRAYQQLEDESPSPALDRVVIAAARDAIGAQQQPRRQWRWPSLALAATVLLSFAIVMRLSLPTDKRSAVPAPPAATPAELGKSLPSPQAPAPAAVAPESARLAAPALARERLRAAPASRDEDKKLEAADAVSTQEMDSVNEAPAAPGSVAQPPLAAASAPEPATSGLTSPSAKRAFSTSSSINPSASPKDARQKAAAKKSGVKPAKEWLEEIARLRASGQAEAADREFASFQKTYPNYVHGVDTTPTQ
ncbi:MAG TPA: hypothetical protein VEZ88_07475 [Steroidobacteraceae bacterium]|nr:hypothetical protein [Steroidobacteraceae bacterium]